MAKLSNRNAAVSPTADAIYKAWEGSEDEWRRPHLGASSIGKQCHRFTWYTFRWVARPEFSVARARGQMLRLFDRGKREEAVIYAELRRAGFTVSEGDEHGNQWRVSFLGGHFGGGADGAVLGIPEAPLTWHLLELKTHNAERFEKLEKEGVLKANPEHYDQMQTYMRGLNLKRALYFAVCKDDDRIYTERIEYDGEHARRVEEKARIVIEANEPLSRVSENPTWYECKMCSFYKPCQLGAVELLARNCRTCISSTARPDGTWWCEHKQTTLDVAAQRAGCGEHLLIPKLLPYEAVSFDPQARSVSYRGDRGLRVVDHGGKLITAIEET